MDAVLAHLSNASATIKSAMSAMTSGSSGINEGEEAHEDGHGHGEGEKAPEGGDDISTTNPIPHVPGDASTIDGRIDTLEQEEVDLLEQRRDLEKHAPIAGPAVGEKIAEIDARLAEIQAEIDAERVLLNDEYQTIHNDSILDLQARLDSLPSHPNFASDRLALEQEIAVRTELYDSGITEPYIIDSLTDMSNSTDPVERNTVDRILDGDANIFSFSEQEASLADALAEDRNFDPENEIALYRPPENNVIIYSKGVGGLFLNGTDGNILVNDSRFSSDKGIGVVIHEVNHAVNADGKYDFAGEHTGDDRRAIGSVTTEMRAYGVDNRFGSDATDTANKITGGPPAISPGMESAVRQNRIDVILTDLGYTPGSLTGNQVHIAEAVGVVVDGFPAAGGELSDENVAQLERLYIADHVLERDIAADTTYNAAVDQYNATESVRDTVTDIIVNGAGGNVDNSSVELES